MMLQTDIEKADWTKAEEVWLQMGDQRSLKRLRQYMRSAQRVSISLKDLEKKLNKLDLYNKARHFDRQVTTRLSAIHREEFAEELQTARVHSIRKATGIFDDLLDTTADYMGKAKEDLKHRRFDPSTLNSLVNASVKFHNILENTDPGTFNLAAREMGNSLETVESIDTTIMRLERLKQKRHGKREISAEELLGGDVIDLEAKRVKGEGK